MGIVNFFGGHYLPQKPCYWVDARIESVNYIQGEKINNEYYTRKICHSQYKGDEHTYVAASDGVFMAIPAKLFSNNLVKWDVETYTGFHFYDMDMAMQMHHIGYKIEILWDVILEHTSCGLFNNQFVEARNNWYAKWKKDLPIMCGVSLTEEQMDVANTCVDIANALYDSTRSQSLLLQSKEYKLGRCLLYPIRIIKKIVKRVR